MNFLFLSPFFQINELLLRMKHDDEKLTQYFLLLEFYNEKMDGFLVD